MKRALILLCVLCLAICLISGCKDEEKDQLKANLASANDLVKRLQSDTLTLRQEAASSSAKIVELQAVCGKALDTISQKNKSIQKLNAMLAVRKKTVDSLKGVIVAMTPATIELPKVQNELAGEHVLRVAAEAQISDLTPKLASRDALISDIRPWFLKYKHDAGRGFIKVMIKADKAKTPGSPEPIF